MDKLKHKYKNIVFENPFILASSPISRNEEMINRAFDLGWGGAVTKTICLNHETMINASPRFYTLKNGNKHIGFNNIELISEKPLSYWQTSIEKIKGKHNSKVLIASIMADAEDIDGWIKLAKSVESAGADIIELNLSCPNGLPDRKMGSYLSEMPDFCKFITSEITKNVKIPVWTKLSPNVTDISLLAKACLAGNADGIAAINTVKGFSGIDIETFEPKLNINGYSTYGGFSGEIIKPIALKAVSEIAQNHGCYISATGGIKNWQDSVEFMLLGASNVQICTEVMLNGYEIINKLKDDLIKYLDRKNFNNIEEIIGLSLNKIKKFENLNLGNKLVACIDSNNCNRCKKCLISCKDAGYQAIKVFNNGELIINQDDCDGCGLCKLVCPSNSIKMKSLQRI